MSIKIAFLLGLLFSSGLVVLVLSENIWHSYKSNTGYGNREELVVTNVTINDEFTSGVGVKLWKSVAYGSGSYAIGLMNRGLTLVKIHHKSNTRNLDVQTKIIDVRLNVTNLEFFRIWNQEIHSDEMVVIISSTASELISFRLDPHKLELEKLWFWNFQIDVSSFYYHHINGQNSLLIMSKNNDSKGNVFIYGFEGPRIWLVQVIPLQCSATTLTVTELGTDSFLSVPQTCENSVQIFKYKQDRFVSYENVSSAGVTQIQSFKIGFKSFLVVNGYDAGIYRFTKDGVTLEEHGLNFDGIEFWLILPVKTYRDEVIIIKQSWVHHGSHKSILIELVIFNGEQFVHHEEMPCSFHGVTENGLTCMVDEDEESGLIGSAALNINSALGVLVPGVNQSRLFTFDTKLKVLGSPVELEIEILEATKQRLKEMIKEQQMNMELIQNRFHKEKKEPTAAGVEQNKPKINEIILGEPQVRAAFDIDEMRNRLNDTAKSIQKIIGDLSGIVFANAGKMYFKELILNGELEAKRTSSFDAVTAKTLNEEVVPDVINDVVRKYNVQPIKGKKTFTDIDVQRLTFQNINGRDSRSILYNNNSTIILNGDIIVENDLEVFENLSVKNLQLNGFDIEKEMVQMGKKYPDRLHFHSVKVNSVPSKTDTVTINGNLSIGNINDEDMENFKKSICLTNIENRIPAEIFITQGVLNNTGKLSISYLNGLKFLEEYILTNTSEVSKILGEKQFKGNITIDQLIIDGTINNVDPNSLITLNNDQEFSGIYSFNNLEVTKDLGIKGNVSGSHTNEFLENPTLSQTHAVKAQISCKSLEVEGIVVISGIFNGTDFADSLSDVVYADQNHALITSIKTFPAGISITNGIHIESNLINTTPLDQLITSNSEQTLSIQSWNGDVEFRNLHIIGLYNGINVTQLDQETVKLTGEQFVSAILSFENFADNFVDISATDFIITNMLNDIPVQSYLFTTGESRNLVVDTLKFDNVIAKDVIVDGEVFGSVNEFSIKDFDSRRVSVTKDQTFTAKYQVDNLETSSMKAKLVNKVLYESLFDIQYYADVVLKMLFDGKLKISNLHVNGSLSAQTLNGIDLGILQRCFWTNKNNYFKTTTFKGDVFLKSLSIGHFNSVNFRDFSFNVVMKHETNLTVKSLKTFTNGLHVVKYIDSSRLNGIPVDAILTKSGSQEILGPLNIYGDVFVSDTEINENLNEISMEYLRKTFEFVDNTVIVNDDMVFNRLAYIDRLWIDSYAQDYKLSDFLSNIVYFDQNHQFIGPTIFKGPVHIKENVVIEETFNQVDLSEFFEDVVLITKPDSIEGSVIFNQYVHVENDLLLSTNLDARLLYGIDLSLWGNAVFVNEGFIPGFINFEYASVDGNVYVNYINDLNMSAIIPLRGDQVIIGTLEIREVKPFHDFLVSNYVNGFKLADLIADTIFKNVPSQMVTSPIIFSGNVLIRENLHIIGHMNGKNISNIVTTNTEQTITSKLAFIDRVVLDSNLNVTTERINNINLPYWQQQCVLISSKPQEIYNRWTITGNLTFKGNVDGVGSVAGLNMRKLADDVEAKRFYKSVTERNLVDGYINMCKDVNTLVEKAQNQIYLFRYFEKLDSLIFDNTVLTTFSFMHQHRAYLLVNEARSCITSVFQWNENKFSLLNKFPTGNVDQFISVREGNRIFIISNGAQINCDISGTNVWQFTPENIVLLYKMDSHTLLHDSAEPGRFYGVIGNELVEYRLQTTVETIIKRYRKWDVRTTDKVAFVPRGIGIGLCLYNKEILMKMSRDDMENNDDDQYGYATNAYIVGKVVYEDNVFLPVPIEANIAVLNVGGKKRRRSLCAVAKHEETRVKGKLDVIKIYEDVYSGKLFHKIPAYKPSSLISLEFANNGETLLLFLENKKVIQVYGYKGIEGFQHRTTIDMQGSTLFSVEVPQPNGQGSLYVVGVIDSNQIHFLQAEIVGNQLVESKIDCDL